MKFIALSKLKTANSQVYFILNDQCPYCDLDEELRKIVPVSPKGINLSNT